MQDTTNQENGKTDILPNSEEKQVLENVVRGDDTRKAIIASMRDICKQLDPHNGPFATNAATVGQSQHSMIDEFTKDGITILSRLGADNPQDELSRRLIEFIGKRIDDRCHDGTTTSMMSSASLAANWLSTISPTSRRDQYKSIALIKKIISVMEEAVEANTFTIEELLKEVSKKNPKANIEEVRARIFFDTIMTSSKGDVELAERMTEVLVTLPEELYNYVPFEHNNSETDTRFEAVLQEADISLKGTYQGNFSLLSGNEMMGSVFNMEEAHVLVTGNELLDGSPESIYLQQWISNVLMPTTEQVNEYDAETNEIISTATKAVPSKKELSRPLIILARNTQQSHLVRLINLYNAQQADWNKKIFCFQYFQEHALSYQAIARAIPAMSDTEDRKSIIEAMDSGDLEKAFIPCKFWACGSIIEISNLYTRDNRRFHPFYYDKTKTRYHNLIKEMADTINQSAKRHLDVDAKLEKFAYDLIYIQRFMICQEIKTLRVCSTTHEMFANSTAVEDALGSAMSVAKEGVIMSGYQKIVNHLYNHLKEMAVKYTVGELREQHDLVQMLSATVHALEDVIKSTYALSDEEFKSCRTTLIQFNRRKNVKFLYNNAYDPAPFAPRNAVKELADGTSNAIFQPVAGFNELLVRVKDIITKLISTHSILTMKSYM